MSKTKAFDLGDYLRAADSRPYGEAGAVSEQDTREQIEYIDLDRIDPDPENFYSLEGLEELAANIELVGLQQPLRVRPALSVGSAETLSGAARQLPQRGSRDRFIVVSGHRRRAACLLIRDGGSAMFRGGVPCIVERGDTSKEMQELRLIYANSATRVMSSAELSKQAVRVEELLYKLKNQGVAFPGRMRDHVAAAVNASKTKLARLHAIRGKLVPELLKMFDAGEINEAVAYRISQEEAAVQAKILEDQGSVLRHLTADGISSYVAQLRFMQNRKVEPVGAAISRPQKDDGGPPRAEGELAQSAERSRPGPSAPTEDADDAEEDCGRSRASAPTEIRPTWKTGTPQKTAYYAARLEFYGKPIASPRVLWWDEGVWYNAVGDDIRQHRIDSQIRVVGWWPLPEKEGA